MNNSMQNVTEAELNAFLDNQLDENEKSRVLAALNDDPALQTQLAELRQLRDMYLHAYENPPRKQVAKQTRVSRATPRRLGIAASILLTVGIIFGWLGNAHFSINRVHAIQEEDMLDKTSRTAAVKNVILHVTSGDTDRLDAALDDAENLLQTYAKNEQPLKLEIIANDGGLNLMRKDISIYQQRISSLTSRYENVTFLACARAIKRLESKGIEVELLPEINIAPSALEQIIERMQDGWQYIKA